MPNSFWHFWGSLKRACYVEWALWKTQSNLFRNVSTYSLSWSCIFFPNTLDSIGKRLRGLKLSLFGLNFLNTGTLSGSFRVSWNLLSLKALLIYFISSLNQNFFLPFLIRQQEILRLLLYLRVKCSQHSLQYDQKETERTIYVYFDFLPYFQNTWMFWKFEHSLVNFVIPLKKV